MSEVDSTPPPGPDVTAAKVTLLTLLVAWAALLAWVLANADTLVRPVMALFPDEGSDMPPVPAIVVDTLPGSDLSEGARERVSTDGAVLVEPSATRARDRGGSSGAAIGLPAPVATPPEAAEIAGPIVSRALEASEARESVEAAKPVVEPVRERSVAGDERALESRFEARRLAKLASLPEIASGLHFQTRSGALSASLREPLERVFEILSLYPDTAVDIMVTGNEYEDTASDLFLSRTRGQTIVDHLVSRGLERGRFELDIGVGDGLPPGEHRVRVLAEDDFR